MTKQSTYQSTAEENPQNQVELMNQSLELMQNLQQAGQIYLQVLQKLQSSADQDVPFDPLGVGENAVNSLIALWQEPEKAWQKQTEYFQNITQIWTHYFLDGQKDAPKQAQKIDKRLKNPEWDSNPVLAFMKSTYIYSQSWAQDMVEELSLIDEHEKIVARFSMRNFIEALNPANFMHLNPEVLDVTLKEKGENLVRGMTMLLEDVERGNGQLLLRQVDYDAFEVGKNIAITPGEVIYENAHFQLIQYEPQTETVHKTPILICPPWINKYYILDLNEKKSLAKWLTAQGYSVFMISWRNADQHSGDQTWENRLEAVSGAIDVVLAECEAPQTHLVSFCIGGTMIGTLLAHDQYDQSRIASSTFLTAQFDFEHAGELLAYVNKTSVELLDRYDEQGFIPAQAMSSAFNMLRSSDLIWNYLVNNYWLGKTPMAFDLLYWNSDSMCMPTKVQKFYLDKFYLENAFMNESLEIDGRKLGVKAITTPSYHLAAIDDHIAPAASVYFAAKAMKNANVRFVLGGSGHIAGVVNPPQMQKYGYWTHANQRAKNLENWKEKAEYHEGSWWLDWKNWLESFSDETVKARKAGAKHQPIEPAPGRYVKKRFDEILPE